MKARTKVAEALNLVVRERRKSKQEGKEEKKNDMLAALLDSGDNFSDEQIVDFMLALLVAGYETTSTIMTLAIKFVTETPLALAQLRVSFYPPLSTSTFFCLLPPGVVGGHAHTSNTILSYTIIQTNHIYIN